MKTARLASPGSLGGPCVTCDHPDCAAERHLSAMLCAYCGAPLGYETDFVDIGGAYIHAACEEESIERR